MKFMKPIILKLWMVVAMLCIPISTFAYDFEVDGFYFDVTNQSNNEVAVTYKEKYYGTYSGTIVIPSSVSYNGTDYTVTSIAESAFSDCPDLISVTIPNSVTRICYKAFWNCENIQSLTIGSGVKYIESYAFTNSTYSTYYIAKVIWLCNTPPAGASEVKADLNYVSNSEFSFYRQAVYPFLSSRFEVDGVIYVPVSPSERTCDVIDYNYTPSNTEITIDSIVSNKNIELKVLNINKYAFYRNSKITKLTISNNGIIDEKAFYDCDALTSVVASNNGYIGDDAFYDCDSLTSVVASNNGYIGDRAFKNCGALTSITATNQGSIWENAFESCVNLKTADLKISGRIFESAFQGCSSLESAYLNIVGSIGNYAFEGCKNLKTVLLGDKITGIGESAFSGNSSLETIIIPDNIASLGVGTFKDCSSLKDISIGYGLGALPKKVFSGCISLPSIVIPYNIKEIDDYTFYGCKNLEDVTFEELPSDKQPQYFPDWTYTKGDYSHEYIIDVEAGDALSFEIWDYSEDSYDYRVYLNGRKIHQSIGNLGFTHRLFLPFFKSESVTLKVQHFGSKGNAGIRKIVLNSDIVTLGSDKYKPIFSTCKLDEVFIGRKLVYNSGKDYGYSPFYRNTSLRKVTISGAETQIYDNEFYGCSNLKEFSCGDGVVSIGNWAFSGCSSLESYLSGTSVETIGKEAFSDCTAMTSFTSNANVPPVCGSQALDDINKWECTLYVPHESVDDYQVADQWKEFFFVGDAGIEDITVDNLGIANCPIEIYNLSGLKVGDSVDNLKPGIYLKRQGHKTEKIIIK